MRNLFDQLKQITKEQWATFIITVSLCLTWFNICQEHGWGGDHDLLTSFVFTAMSHSNHIGPNHNPKIAGGHFGSLQSAWKGRVLSLWCAGVLIDLLDPESIDEMNFAVGFYQLFWLVATILLLWLVKLFNLRVMLFVFIGLIFSLTPDPTIYPWDMPSMFMWTLVYVLWHYGKLGWMTVAIILGTLFKETVAVLALLFLFRDGAKARRIDLFVICFVGCVVCRLLISHFVLGQTTLINFASTPGWPSGLNIFNEITRFFSDPFNLRILFVGGGVFLVAFIFPIDKRIKFIMGVTLLCLTVEPILCHGNYECRVFDDILPILAVQLRGFRIT